jgi:lambda repressor-like predicted transcriptional regulator
MIGRNRRLLVAMAERGWTSRKLAAAAKLSEWTISTVLNGTNTSPRAMQLISTALGADVNELFEEAINDSA